MLGLQVWATTPSSLHFLSASFTSLRAHSLVLLLLSVVGPEQSTLQLLSWLTISQERISYSVCVVFPVEICASQRNCEPKTIDSLLFLKSQDWKWKCAWARGVGLVLECLPDMCRKSWVQFRACHHPNSSSHLSLLGRKKTPQSAPSLIYIYVTQEISVYRVISYLGLNMPLTSILLRLL